MKLIVVGVDGSPNADTATRWAAQLGQAVGARVLTVHVVPTAWEWELAAFQVDTRPLIQQRQRDLAGRWTQSLRDEGVTYTTRFVRGNPGKELLRIAEEQDADLIVIGAKPHRAVHDLVVGGTTHQLVNQDRRPVVLVPSRVAVQSTVRFVQDPDGYQAAS